MSSTRQRSTMRHPLLKNQKNLVLNITLSYCECISSESTETFRTSEFIGKERDRSNIGQVNSTIDLQM